MNEISPPSLPKLLDGLVTCAVTWCHLFYAQALQFRCDFPEPGFIISHQMKASQHEINIVFQPFRGILDHFRYSRMNMLVYPECKFQLHWRIHKIPPYEWPEGYYKNLRIKALRNRIPLTLDWGKFPIPHILFLPMKRRMDRYHDKE